MSALAIAAGVLLAAAATGCYPGYGATPVYAQPTVQASVEAPLPAGQIDATLGAPGVSAPVEPQLVSIAPSVQVIADYDEPIFYTGGFYWRETAGGWYRSNHYSGGWSYYNDAPYSLRTIENRGSYRNYRPAGYVRRNYGTVATYDRGYNRGYQQPVVRDHRAGYGNTYNRGYGNTYNQPVRDHRYGNGYSGTYNQPVRDHRYGSGGYNQPVRGGGYTGSYNQPVRDHRGTYTGGGYTGNRGYQQPVVRDHRTGYSGDTRSSRPVVRDNRGSYTGGRRGRR